MNFDQIRVLSKDGIALPLENKNQKVKNFLCFSLLFLFFFFFVLSFHVCYLHNNRTSSPTDTRRKNDIVPTRRDMTAKINDNKRTTDGH